MIFKKGAGAVGEEGAIKDYICKPLLVHLYLQVEHKRNWLSFHIHGINFQLYASKRKAATPRLPHGYLFRPETLLARTIITNTPIWTSI